MENFDLSHWKSIPDGFVVYIIKHPETLEIFYVGQTRSLARRALQHIKVAAHRRRDHWTMKPIYISGWILSLLALNMLPVFEVVEHCQGEDEALAAESRWIEKLTAEGADLLNGTKLHRSLMAQAKARRSAT